MSIDVSLAKRNEGIQYPFEESLSLGTIQYEMGDIHTEGDTEVSGTVMGVDGKILLEGRIDVLLSQLCDRCAEPFERSYRFGFSELFTDGQISEDSDDYPFQSERIDLEKMVQDCIVLQLPSVNLCMETCKGLCPVCGINRNHANCNCNIELSGPFGVLAGLMDRVKEDE